MMGRNTSKTTLEIECRQALPRYRCRCVSPLTSKGRLAAADPSLRRRSRRAAELVATAVLCRFGISPRIQENERESKKTGMRRRLRCENGTATASHPKGFSKSTATPLFPET
jgi:hypothetical protein